MGWGGPGCRTSARDAFNPKTKGGDKSQPAWQPHVEVEEAVPGTLPGWQGGPDQADPLDGGGGDWRVEKQLVDHPGPKEGSHQLSNIPGGRRPPRAPRLPVSWSVESKASTQTTSGSESGSQKTSPSVSRTASCASDSNASESSWTTSRTETTTLSKTLTRDNNSKESKSKHDIVQRTVTTLMGGRGYIQWRATHLERNKTSHLAQINNSDAYLVIWDHRL